MEEFSYESGYGHSDCPECGRYVPETVEDYVTSVGEVRRKTVWDCLVCGEVEKDIAYPIEHDDDCRFVWGAFLSAKKAGVVHQDVPRPLNSGV